MTPKEKAKELVDKYIKLYPSYVVMWKEDIDEANKNIKQCALIAVDEILDDDMYGMEEEHFEKRINYWEEVKREIEKL